MSSPRCLDGKMLEHNPWTPSPLSYLLLVPPNCLAQQEDRWQGSPLAMAPQSWVEKGRVGLLLKEAGELRG